MSKYHQETYDVIFDDNCRYDIGQDQTDKNKLFGWSYGFHHINSARVTWYYDKECDGIRLCLYIYNDGKCIKHNDSNLYKIGEKLNIKLTSYICNNTISNEEEWRIEMIVNETAITSCIISKHNLCNWGYTLGLYFGGNCRAPHDISVQFFAK